MAISKERKRELVDQYMDWLGRSQVVLLADYRGSPTKSIYQLRTKVRTTQGEFHVIKNTLMKRALQQVGMPVPEDWLEGPTAATFCFEDPPAVAKALIQFADDNETFSVKGGLAGDRLVDTKGVKSLSELPPRPVLMGQVLGTIQAPAGKAAGVVNAALRQIAAIIQARVDQLKAAEGAA